MTRANRSRLFIRPAVKCIYAGQTITIKEALLERKNTPKSNWNELPFQCVECGEPVRPHKKGTNGAKAHFEHNQRNEDCSLSDPPRK